MTDAADAWLEMFFAFFAQPSRERYVRLFHPEGTLLDAGMDRPLPAAETGDAIAMVLAKLPDLKIEPLRHRTRGDHVFVEARNTGTLQGRRLEWGATYRVRLKDGLVHRGRRFYDQVELLAPLLPPDARLPAFDPAAFRAGAPEPRAPACDAPRSPEALVEALAAAWASRSVPALCRLYAAEGRLRAPGLPAPVGGPNRAAWFRYLFELVPDLRVEPVDWAGDADVLFVEWQGTGSYLGEPVPLDRVERYRLDAGGRIRDSRAYFDTLTLVERRHPAVAAIRAGLIKR